MSKLNQAIQVLLGLVVVSSGLSSHRLQAGDGEYRVRISDAKVEQRHLREARLPAPVNLAWEPEPESRSTIQLPPKEDRALPEPDGIDSPSDAKSMNNGDDLGSEQAPPNQVEKNEAEPSKPGPRCGRYCLPGCCRAGFPHELGLFAKAAPCSDYAVGYVGGGTLFRCGDRRTVEEGTFGLDYQGNWFTRKVWLRWSHGRRHQGGEGAYKTDGLKLHE